MCFIQKSDFFRKLGAGNTQRRVKECVCMKHYSLTNEAVSFGAMTVLVFIFVPKKCLTDHSGGRAFAGVAEQSLCELAVGMGVGKAYSRVVIMQSCVYPRFRHRGPLQAGLGLAA